MGFAILVNSAFKVAALPDVVTARLFPDTIVRSVAKLPNGIF